VVACEISGQLPQLESPDPQALAAALIGKELPLAPLQWVEDHSDLQPTAHTHQSLAELAARHTLIVYLTPSEAREEDEDAETMGRAYCDHDERICDLGALVVGVSTQPIAEQHEIAGLEVYPQTLFCDEYLVLARALGLPITINAARVEYQPLVLIIKGGVVAHVIYPIDSPGESATAAIEWLAEHAGGPNAGAGQPTREQAPGGENE
jgi:peroxiredoxin